MDPDTAIALRQVRAFPPVRLSVFEDPADEKSSHGSQRYSGLISHFEGREPSWYDSITEEFSGLDRVLDLGAGPGLTLRAFSAHGVREPIGIDRWQGFLQDAETGAGRLILHDLTLPMPFLRSGSFNGIFSHFVLDYISPIGVQQVLREAARLLAPGGLLALHLSAAGLVLGDRVRTTPYDGPAVTKLLAGAGFEDITIEQPDTRRIIIARARGAEPDPAGTDGPSAAPAVLEYEAGGEIQISAGCRSTEEADDGPSIFVEVSDATRAIDYRPRIVQPSEENESDAILDVSLCLRLVPVWPEQFELQAWTWQGSRIAAIDLVRLPMRPELVRVRVEGSVEHHDAWRPAPPMLEEPGDAYTEVEGAAPSLEPDEEWRARGRQVIVAREGDDGDLLRDSAKSKDHFVVDRPDPDTPDVEALERDWIEGQLHGIALELEPALRPESLPLLLWAAFRGLLVYLEPATWAGIERTAHELPSGFDAPLLCVDPILSGRAAPEAEVEAFPSDSVTTALATAAGLQLVLAPATAAGAAEVWRTHPTRVLIGGTDRSEPLESRLLDEATENLRYLTERALLAWYRAISGRTGGELGRYGRLTAH